jgi:hypothetical protein
MHTGGYKLLCEILLTYIQIYQYVSLYKIIYGEKQNVKNT